MLTSTPPPHDVCACNTLGKMEKEEKRKKNLAEARRFDAEFQRELELRKRELEEERGR